MRRAIAIVFLGCAALGACAVRSPAPEPSLTAPAEAPPRAWQAAALSELRAVAAAAPAEGLASEARTIEMLDNLERAAAHDAGAAAELDAAAAALFRALAFRFALGAVDPAAVDPDWHIPRAPPPDVAALRTAIAGGESPRAALRALLPASRDYTALAEELTRVLQEPAGTSDAAGLARDVRIERLRVNLERLRWLPRDLPVRRIDVRIPFFELEVREGDAPLLDHEVIVGARRTPTPSFVAQIESVTLNPSWTPPQTIAAGELLPRFRRDPSAAAREGFDVLDSHGQVVDAAAVDWRARPFPYVLRQRPGASNALGRLRFDLPNPFAIFLHDTPSRGLFARADRALSHGCIRVAEPLTLAETALADSVWDAPALEAAIAAGNTRVIPLGEPLPVYVLYLTAAPDAAGAVRYAEDIYHRDALLVRALDARRREAPPQPTAAMAMTCGAAR